jgi:predicted GNAT family acetyltransferase
MSEVREDAGAQQYEVHVDGVRAGLAHYRLVREGRVFDHTEIDPAFEGKGLGSVLARGALDDVIERGIPFAATCPFIVNFLDRHPEYGEKVDTSLA